MIFYSEAVSKGLLLTTIPALLGLVLFLWTKRERLSVYLLGASAFLLRVMMISLDPYLQDWDERFHAIVAKNMMSHPFTPMLRLQPITPYKIEEWCCNHIWLHKQPLFLWQMALSMKLWGVNEVAMRLPSAIMGALAVMMLYEIAKYWTQNKEIAYLSAALLCFSYYQLELTAGSISLDQNDVAFAFYVTASIWAFIRYVKRDFVWKWAVLIGVFAGGAILNKWLTGLLVFGGWGLFILLSDALRQDKKHWFKLLGGVGACLLVFLPWQIYISFQFPAESSFEYQYNQRHIFEVLEGHGGGWDFHIQQIDILYGEYLYLCIPLAWVAVFWDKEIKRNISWAFLAMILVVYGFFSLIVQTKMQAFPYLVNGLIWISIAIFVVKLTQFLLQKITNPHINNGLQLGAYCAACWYVLLPQDIIEHRAKSNEERNDKIHNTQIYKQLDLQNYPNRIVMNCKSFEDVELMFHQNVNAFHWYFDEKTLDSLTKKGYQFAAFQNHKEYVLPAYITNNPNVLIIPHVLR